MYRVRFVLFISVGSNEFFVDIFCGVTKQTFGRDYHMINRFAETCLFWLFKNAFHFSLHRESLQSNISSKYSVSVCPDPEPRKAVAILDLILSELLA